MADRDRVLIRDLRAKARIGVTEEERLEPRELVVDVDIDTDFDTAARTDDLGQTVDYAAVARAVSEVVSAGETKLLEHLAHEVAERLLGFAGVTGVRVEIRKERPPMTEDVGAAGVVIERRLGE
ncbi:MAG TPA: dihydroneopterin aldolase [Actinomycetota bacterium]|nr:dihydroneopterin aldolase [Actinomycetota bacterium]